MSAMWRRFTLGLIVGIAVALIAAQSWVTYERRIVTDAAQPRLSIPFAGTAGASASSGRLARPWFPETVPGPLASWKVWTLAGRTIKLSDFRGQVLFLNLMSASCVPCVAEMPSIERLYAGLRGSPVAFLIVSEDDPSVRKFEKENSGAIPFFVAKLGPPPDLIAPGEHLYIPTTIILDKSGRAVFRHVGALNWDDPAARQFILGLTTQ